MTQIRTFAALILALAGFAAIAVLMVPSPGASQAVAAAPAEITFHRIDAIPTIQLNEVAALVPDADLSTDQLEQVSLVADQICEGITAGVPLMNMADSLVWNQGLTDTEAHDFVREVAQTHC